MISIVSFTKANVRALQLQMHAESCRACRFLSANVRREFLGERSYG